MGLSKLKPNIVDVDYLDIYCHENLTHIRSAFVSMIHDCIVGNKAVGIVNGHDEQPNDYQR